MTDELRDRRWQRPIIEIGLSKDDVAAYKWACRVWDIPTDRHRSSRQVQLTPRHWTQLTLAAADISAEERMEQAEIAQIPPRWR